MSTQLHHHLMQTHSTEIARNAAAGRHAASLRTRRGARQSGSRSPRGLFRLAPVLRTR